MQDIRWYLDYSGAILRFLPCRSTCCTEWGDSDVEELLLLNFVPLLQGEGRGITKNENLKKFKYKCLALVCTLHDVHAI